MLVLMMSLILLWILNGSAIGQGVKPCNGNTTGIGSGGFKYSSYCGSLSPTRVVIVTAANRMDRLHEQEVFAEAMASSLGRFVDVVRAEQVICDGVSPLKSGRFDEHQLLRLKHELDADAVLYCDVQQLSAYAPLRIQVSMLLVHIDEAVALVAGTAMLDTKDSQVAEAYRTFSVGKSPNEFLDVHDHSPRDFIRFSATVLASQLTPRFPEWKSAGIRFSTTPPSRIPFKTKIARRLGLHGAR